ncbi:Uma2 family endonuclease [Falsiroseomonas sp. E2-1-a20]|uniref:Uma2 family endonuclease n=1 Tax=Falsiroseomonas sp. E2-1-a20 TaxID=3239300 RepID=UPI003F39AF8D
MSAHLKPLTLEEFLAWEAAQEERFEFDGTQPVAMTGASLEHARLVTRVILALSSRLRPGCEVLAHDMKVVTEGRVRYPDLVVVCGPVAANADRVSPSLVIEVLSPSTSLTDMRVKPAEYARHPSVLAYVTLEQDSPRIVICRREAGWQEEVFEGLDAAPDLPEVEGGLPLRDLYQA